MMHKRELRKPDGRAMTLYARAPIDPGIVAPSPNPTPVAENAHLRWHPVRGEWVAYASHRQDRTFLPPKEFNPLAPMRSPDHPTELPQGDYDVAVFDNLFPTLSPRAGEAPEVPGVTTMPAIGACEVVVFTKDPDASLARLPLPHIVLLIEAWADRYRVLGARPAIKYVMPFENRGAEVGVTLHHPHGQIYAYPFVPPVPERALAEMSRHFEAHGRTLMSDVIANEEADGRRMLYAGPHAVAFVPAFARYPYEVWVTPRRAAPSLADLDEAERADYARALKTVLLKYEGLWQRPFPYLMVFHQAPTDGEPHPESHFHAEFSPPYRNRERLKYLAGTELGAGMFANDTIPEAKARELQEVQVTLD